jgi:hypothetical protein
LEEGSESIFKAPASNPWLARLTERRRRSGTPGGKNRPSSCGPTCFANFVKNPSQIMWEFLAPLSAMATN